MRPLWKQALPLVLVAAVGCKKAASGDASVTRSDSAGIAIVRNLAPDHDLSWRYVEQLRLGSALDANQAFFGVDRNSFAFDSAGRIYILDKGNYSVRVFNAAGEPLQVMGRKGGGRGELTHPIALRVAPAGGVRVLDFGKQSWTVFEEDGSAGEGEPIEDVTAFGWQISWTDSGFVTGFRRGYRTDSDSVIDGVKLVEGSDTTVLGSVGMLQPKEQMYRECRMIIPLPPVFARTLEWDAAGQKTAVNDRPEYVIKVFEGPVLKMIVRRNVEPQPMTREDAEESIRGKMTIAGGEPCTIGADKVIDARGFEPELQAISGISLAPDGTMWVRRARRHPTEAASVDVIDASGRYLGTLPEGGLFPVAFDPQGRPVAIEKDEMDVEQIVVYTIVED